MADSNTHTEDYISTESIKRSVLYFFRLLFRTTEYALHLGKKYIITFLVFILLGTGLGYLKYTTTRPYYKLTMLVECNDLTKKTFHALFAQVDELAKSMSYDRLAAALQMNHDTARMVAGITISGVNDEPLEKDSSTKKGFPLLIIANVYDNSCAEPLQNGLLNYINNNPYLQKNKTLQKKVYEDKLVFIDKELSKLDSLKNEYTRSINSAKNVSTYYNNAFNPAQIYIHSDSLFSMKEEILKAIEEKEKSVTVISGFSPVNLVYTRSLSRSLLIGFLAGLLLSGFIVFINEIRNKVRETPDVKRDM